ncbi:type VI secretion system protein ImpK [Pseudoxanthomonas kalamensis DSM 18571]|uniref:DotU family type IV/VI secretion system protein n=1 Tax=Pseudoxanthomonas kalamensis TaxID=289483 RepID=UPI00139141B5|nr:DotU family type IV/VI secretion system protein [Pseudoxanthomonas kalamensis]KAF1712005.1 type VI secretion system protein ImpK [Pseudoxanthomonas kalamensis DSM 18571]
MTPANLPPVPKSIPTGTEADAAIDGRAAAPPRRLLDLMFDGFYLLMLLKRGQLPSDEEKFVESVRQFLDRVERGASKLGIASEDTYAAKYAFCAAVDEAILSQPSPLRESWERNPLQLRLFGEHLAGEHFFDRLEELRAQGGPRLASLEVYHYCLLLGFEGKYRLEGPEKLGYLTARLGDEITFLKGKRVGFAPHWPPPDSVAHALRRIVPVWAPAVLLAVFGVLGYFGVNALLARDTEQKLAAYQDVVQLPPSTAHVTITLP